MGQCPELSVVVIGRNEGDRLAACLSAIKRMQYSGKLAEIIYVDSNSTDGSPERAAGFGATVITIRPERPTAAIGRNAGWRRAVSPVVLFLDGDTLLDPDFVSTAIDHLKDPGTAVVFGNRREVRPQDSIYNRILDLDWISPPGPADYCGGDALIRRSVLEEVGGYDESLIAGEEPDMCRRIRGRGYRILHIEVPMTGHDLAMNHWSQYWRRAIRTGYAYAEVSARYRCTHMPLWSREAKGNIVNSSVLIVVTSAGLVSTVFYRSFWPLIGVTGFWATLIARTERRIRWKSQDRLATYLYAIHSHVQQIPILIGQLRYFWDRLKSQKRPLIEYKQLPQ